MYTRILSLTFIFFVTPIFNAQTDELKKSVDSIAHNYWSAMQPNLDSLVNPVIIEVAPLLNDTIVIRNEMIIPQIDSEMPVTPYLLNNNPEPRSWYFFGQNTLVINQASFSNWNSGGNDNIGALAKINYNLSYRKGRHYSEHLLNMGYGWIASTGQRSRKTEDFISLMSNYGYDLGRNYYLSTGFQFLSQFAPGYNHSLTPDPEFNDRTSRFLAPGYINAGIGVSYNPAENFQIIFRPANGKFTIVRDPFLQKAGRFGLEYDGQKIRSELGAMLNVIYRLKIYKDITLDNQLNFFSNYLEHPERIDIAYNGVLNIRFNKFISTIVSVDLVYDHDQIAKLQRKQTLGIGFAYTFGDQTKDREFRRKIVKPFIVR